MDISFTPGKIVEELDKYIISQEEAKRNVAVSLRNRFRRKNVENRALAKEITPKNIILIGSTGVGKTEIARRLARVSNSPFIKVEATKYTEVGYVGKDVESIIKDLVNVTYSIVKNEKIEVLKEEVLPEVYGEVLKKLRPYEVNDDEKNKIIEEIKAGKYAKEKIAIEKAPKTQGPIIEVFAGGEEEEGGIQGAIENFISAIPGMKKNKEVEMTVEDAIDYLMRQKVEKIMDGEELGPEVIRRVEEDGIIFIDEIDKIAERESAGRSEVSRQGVQRDILPIVEGTTVMTKYGPCKTDHILFIAAGAFSMSSPSDLMPELQGRFPVRVKLKNLTKEDFIKILTLVENNLVDQYKAMLLVDGVKLEFTKGAIERVAEVAIELNEEAENIGARRLHTVLERVLNNLMFEAPYEGKKEIKLGKKDIDKVYEGVGKEENLDDYIL